MWVEFLLGAALVGILLYTDREHMATGVYKGNRPPTDEESSEIFIQVMTMAPPILHDAYADALAFAKDGLVEVKSFATRLPNDQMLKGLAMTSDDKVVQYAKNAVAGAVIMAGRTASGQGPFGPPGEAAAPGSPITEESLKALVDRLYTQLNQHINDQLPPEQPQPNDTPVQVEMRAKMREYAERARTLVKKYNTPGVRDACVQVLKEYYVDQLKPGWVPSTTGSGDPTARGRILDLESEYQTRKTVYDNLVADALANNDKSKIDAIAAAQIAMSESLSKMLEVSAKSGTESQQEELTRRIMQIQHDYNGLLVGTDKLQTLRLLRQSLDVRDSFGLKVLGVAFLITTLVLLFQIMRTR